MNGFYKIAGHAAGAVSSIARYAQNLVDTPAVVLLYHRVLDEKRDPEQLCVSPRNFAAQMDHLRKKCRVTGADEFCDTLTRRAKFAPGSVVITFDDGYSDNFENALPILEPHGLQALFFVATAGIDKPGLFFWDELSAIVDHILERGPGSVDVEFGGVKFSYGFDTPEAASMSYSRLHRAVKYSKEHTRRAFMAKLRAACGFDPEKAVERDELKRFRMMTSSELRKMSASKSAVVGAHTHTHSPLSVYGYNEQLTDISISRSILEKITGRRVDYFSYPFGAQADYDSSSVAICRELGFKLAFSNFYGQCHRWTDRFQVPRMLVRNWDVETFKARLDKFFKR